MIADVTRFSPQPKQREFLSTSADIAVYGGSAGSGKSFALVYDPIRHIKVPGFTGVIFRRTSPEITNAGGLWDEAGGLYPAAGGKAFQDKLEYRFKPKSRIGFRHLEHENDKFSHQGSQICYLAFDELTHFTESMFFYMLSRNRSTCGVRPYVRATTNPQPGWVKSTLLAPWVDEEYRGERAKSGQILWFRRIGGVITWVPEGTPRSKSVTFIRASVYDNPALLDANPEYLDNLEALPDVERERLLHGNWAVRHEGLVYPEFEKCISNDAERLRVPPTAGGLDYGWRNPFAAVWGHYDHDGCFWITGCRYRSGVEMAIHSEALPKGVEWWADPASPGLTRELCSAGHNVRSCVHIPVRGASGETKSPKMAGIAAVSARMRAGLLKIVRCPETLPLIRELGLYRYDPSKLSEEPLDIDNHACDATRYAVVGHDRWRGLPAAYPLETVEERGIREKAEREAQEVRDRQAYIRDNLQTWAVLASPEDERTLREMEWESQ
jgi:Terminase large subunit, T4likevirus-type, N-terminal